MHNENDDFRPHPSTRLFFDNSHHPVMKQEARLYASKIVTLCLINIPHTVVLIIIVDYLDLPQSCILNYIPRLKKQKLQQ
jgi:hypothetical protein